MNIYISNLDQQVTGEQLTNLFKQYGEVSAAEVAMDVFTDQSRGFAYVEMPNDADAQKAINQLNQSELNSRKLTVEESKPKEERKGSYQVGNGITMNYGFQRNKGSQKKKLSKRRLY